MSLLAFPAVLRAAETFSDSTVPQQQQQKTRTLSGTVLDAVTNEPVIGPSELIPLLLPLDYAL